MLSESPQDIRDSSLSFQDSTIIISQIYQLDSNDIVDNSIENATDQARHIKQRGWINICINQLRPVIATLCFTFPSLLRLVTGNCTTPQSHVEF
jgi:hypothetical protein